MIVYKVTPGKDLNPCTEKRIEDIYIWLEDAEPGEQIIIDVLEMTEDEYLKLPEYMGP